MANEQKSVNVQVKVPEHLKGGSYSNIVSVTTTKAGDSGEVVIDFVFVHPSETTSDGQRSGTLVSRVIMSLEGGKALKLLLESQLGKNRKE